MTARRYELTDFEWSILQPLCEQAARRASHGKSRKRHPNGSRCIWKTRADGGTPRAKRLAVIPPLLKPRRKARKRLPGNPEGLYQGISTRRATTS